MKKSAIPSKITMLPMTSPRTAMREMPRGLSDFFVLLDFLFDTINLPEEISVFVEIENHKTIDNNVNDTGKICKN